MNLDFLLTLPQYLIPQHLLSRLMHRFAHWQAGAFTHWLIKQFIKKYQVDMSIAARSEIEAYPHFNAFFTRALHENARPIAESTFISPVDGVISECGTIQDHTVLQAKNHVYSLTELLAGEEALAEMFHNGQFCTIYLSPRDYHRIHAPAQAQLRQVIYVPGDLFSVNQRTVRTVPRLFARNERTICLFKTKEHGTIAVILVGAVLVGSMETVWTGKITPPYRKMIQHWRYDSGHAPAIQKGAEMGRFNMGSTVILLTQANKLPLLETLQAGIALQMGQALSH